MKPSSTIKAIALFFTVVLSYSSNISAQTIGTFTSVAPGGQTSILTIPSTHTFQRIIKSGDPLTVGNLGSTLDFTGYVPIAGSSTNGYLSISSEITVAEVAILNINYNTPLHRWVVTSSGKVPFPATDLGTVTRFCSGTVTPNGTIIVGEESMSTGDVNTDGYTDVGWLIEINPATRTVVNQNGTGGVDKIWAAGRQSHENCVVRSDNSAIYWGADANPTGYVYKFIPTTAGVWTSGNLYVLDLSGAGTTGDGTWRLIANTTQAQRNNVSTASTTAGATNFNGVEDVEIGPDGKIYFAAKGEGKIYRFTDNSQATGLYGTATDVLGVEVFAGNSPGAVSYNVDGLGLQSWGLGNDNLAFDGEGNLWVCNDGGGGHIWVIRPTHTQAAPQVDLFARTPVGCEPTGITFTPDFRYMFISFMSAAAGGSQTDATGASVTFNTHTTVVIARVEHLGPFSTLPVNFNAFDVKLAGAAVNLNWTVSNINNHDYFSIERSTDGVMFEEIRTIDEDIDGVSERTFTATDNDLPGTTVIYYRIKQCDKNGSCRYSEVRTVKLSGRGQITKLYPQPVNNVLNITYHSFLDGPAVVTITDINGKTLVREKRNLSKGSQSIVINAQTLRSGMYMVTITDKESQITTEKFIKE